MSAFARTVACEFWCSQFENLNLTKVQEIAIVPEISEARKSFFLMVLKDAHGRQVVCIYKLGAAIAAAGVRSDFIHEPYAQTIREPYGLTIQFDHTVRPYGCFRPYAYHTFYVNHTFFEPIWSVYEQTLFYYGAYGKTYG